MEDASVLGDDDVEEIQVFAHSKELEEDTARHQDEPEAGLANSPEGAGGAIRDSIVGRQRPVVVTRECPQDHRPVGTPDPIARSIDVADATARTINHQFFLRASMNRSLERRCP
jgi:hypothetical protein